MLSARLIWIMPLFVLFSCNQSGKQKVEQAPAFAVIAYYSGNAQLIDSFPVEKLTHIIFSFGHLNGNRLFIANAGDTATIQQLVVLKKRNPDLKVILSLGGWGGCETCSPVFATAQGRKEFASSVRALTTYFKTDGIDLDWEYPTIEGHPGHPYMQEDRMNFTSLIQTLRDTLGTHAEISFAAGGYDDYLQRSVDWAAVMPLVDKVNLMSYDLVGGYSKVTGHHTPLYSTPAQKQSTDNAVRYLDSIGVPMQKVIIGAAFYARVWENVEPVNNGLYQAGSFKSFIGYRQFDRDLVADSGYVFYRDTIAKAPYAYNAAKQLYATFDDAISIDQKARYAKAKSLGGIMFWELSLDRYSEGLVDIIDKARR